MKKVVFIVTLLDSGGIENYLLRFLRFFENQIEPIVICKGNVFGEIEEDYKKINHIQLIKMDLIHNLNSFKKLYDLLKNNNVDSIVDFTGNAAGLPLLCANFAGIEKRIVFYRGSSNHFKETIGRLFYDGSLRYITKRNATAILSNSKSALDFFYAKRSIGDSRFKVIYNGIDFNGIDFKKLKKEDFDIPSDGFVIGHTGRYNYAKNHDTIIKVAERICEKYSNIYFVLCGKNTDVELLDIVSKNSILRDKVKLLGYRNDVLSILTVFNLYFFPSITEGQPNALIEAMVSGLPIIASDIGPIKETVPEVLHCELIKPLDFIGFCNRIEEYYLSDSKRKNANFSQWAVKRFSPSELFTQFYSEI